jgi:prepilin-type N-terminal cleavage/methylation domain-containing protein
MNARPFSRKELGARPSQKGFSLLEVVIAISIIAVTFIGILGMLGVGVVNDQTSSQQTAGTIIAESILADLRSTPAYQTKSTRFGLNMPASTTATPLAPFSGVTPSYYLYFDNTPCLLPISAPTAYTAAQSPAPTGAAYVAAVYMGRINIVGPTSTSSAATQTPSLLQSNDMARVVVTWPVRAATPPAGNVDVIAQFLIK